MNCSKTTFKYFFTRYKQKIRHKCRIFLFRKHSYNHIIHIGLRISCCFQCVKGNKFESDSQLLRSTCSSVQSCFQCVKDSESDYFFALKIVYLHQQNDCVMFIFMLPPGTPPDSEEERKSRVRGFLITSIVIVVLYVLLIVLLYYLL